MKDDRWVTLTRLRQGARVYFSLCLRARLQHLGRRALALDRFCQQCFEGGNHEGIVLTGKADSDAAGAGPTGSADTVDVIIRVFGQGEINDMADVVDVNATTGNVCCN